MLSNNIPSPLQYSLHKMHNEGFTFTQVHVCNPTHTYTHTHLHSRTHTRMHTYTNVCQYIINYVCTIIPTPIQKVDAHVCMTHNLFTTGKLASNRNLDALQYRTAPLLRPPLFATYFQEKEGGGRNNEDLRFCLAVKPPPHPTNWRTL